MEALDDLVGRRVALRHRVGERDGRPLYTDAVGELAADGADGIVVRTRRGQVRVRRAAVVAVRAVPPARPRRPSWAAVERLEAVCAAAREGSAPPRVAVGSPAESVLRRQGVVLSEDDLAVLVAELTDLRAGISATIATVIGDHVHLCGVDVGGQTDVAKMAAESDLVAAGGVRWAVTEVRGDDPSALARCLELGFVSHHRVRHLLPGGLAATADQPSPPS